MYSLNLFKKMKESRESLDGKKKRRAFYFRWHLFKTEGKDTK